MLSPIYYSDTLPFFQSHTYQFIILSYTICFNMLSHTYNPNTLSFHQSHSYQFIVLSYIYCPNMFSYMHHSDTLSLVSTTQILSHNPTHIKSTSHETYFAPTRYQTYYSDTLSTRTNITVTS